MLEDVFAFPRCVVQRKMSPTYQVLLDGSVLQDLFAHFNNLSRFQNEFPLLIEWWKIDSDGDVLPNSLLQTGNMEDIMNAATFRKFQFVRYLTNATDHTVGTIKPGLQFLFPCSF